MTAAKLRFLSAVRDEYQRNGGWPLTVRRICEVTGLKSPSTAHRHLEDLAATGHIEVSPLPRGGFRPEKP